MDYLSPRGDYFAVTITDYIKVCLAFEGQPPCKATHVCIILKVWGLEIDSWIIITCVLACYL